MSENENIPKCPKCGKPLENIRIEEGNTVYWNEDHYEDGGQGVGTAVCGNCGKAIGGYGQHSWGFYPEFA